MMLRYYIRGPYLIFFGDKAIAVVGWNFTVYLFDLQLILFRCTVIKHEFMVFSVDSL